jgi:2-polyprenyl-3-methyl-5-hydroxy-6-metoxy-1,4-benzoquinol methylase
MNAEPLSQDTSKSRIEVEAMPPRAVRESLKPPLKCLICGGSRHRVVFREFATDLLQCSACGHVFSSHPADPHYDGFWGSEVADADPYWSTARQPMYQEFLDRFAAGRFGRLLDMGCGLGFFVKAVSQHRGWQAYGCEISPAAVRYGRERLGLANLVCGRLESVDLPAQSFDIVTLWDVIDHVLQPDALIRRCWWLLKDGGFCFIRTPNVRVQLARARVNQLIKGMKAGVTYLQARDHAHHYSTSSIRQLLQRNGFAEVEFVHLRPVQAATGASELRQLAKVAGFHAVRALAGLTGGRLNLDNLFVIARKTSNRTGSGT